MGGRGSSPCQHALARSATSRSTHRLATPLFGQTLLEAALLSRLKVEAVLLDILTNSLSLHLAAEAAKGLFEGLVLTDGDENHGDSRVA